MRKDILRFLSVFLCLLLLAAPASAAQWRAPAAGATISPGVLGVSSDTVVREHRIDSQWYSQTTAAQSVPRYAWDTSRLAELPVNGGRDLHARIRSEGCYAAVIAMLFQNLGLTSTRKAYDPRTRKVDYFSPDPLTITLANMGYPASDAAIKSYSRDPIYMENSYRLATDFGATYVNLDTTAKNSTDKEALVAGLLAGEASESGVIIRVSNLRGGTHFLVLSGFTQYADGRYVFYACDPMDRSHTSANISLEDSATGINYGRAVTDITGLRYFKKNK